MDILLTVIKSGAVVNFFLVVLGCLLGLVFKKGIPEKLKNALITAMALCVIYIGITGLFGEDINVIIIIVSFALGAILGELVDLDALINKLGLFFEKKLSKGDSHFAEGFVTASVLFCVGAMTVVGSLNSGINGDNSTLYSKSVIDCVMAMTLTSSLGLGVMLSCVSVLVIEGALTLLAVFVAPVMTAEVISHFSVIGSILILALGLNMLGITKIKVMNFIPAIFLPLILCLIF